MNMPLCRAVPGQRIHLALPKPSGSLVRRARDTNKNKRLFLPEQEGSLQVSICLFLAGVAHQLCLMHSCWSQLPNSLLPLGRLSCLVPEAACTNASQTPHQP